MPHASRGRAPSRARIVKKSLPVRLKFNFSCFAHDGPGRSIAKYCLRFFKRLAFKRKKNDYFSRILHLFPRLPERELSDYLYPFAALFRFVFDGTLRFRRLLHNLLGNVSE